MKMGLFLPACLVKLDCSMETYEKGIETETISLDYRQMIK